MLESHDQDCSRIISSVYLGAFFNEKMVPVTTFSSRTANVAIKVFLSEEKKKRLLYSCSLEPLKPDLQLQVWCPWVPHRNYSGRQAGVAALVIRRGESAATHPMSETQAVTLSFSFILECEWGYGLNAAGGGLISILPRGERESWRQKAPHGFRLGPEEAVQLEDKVPFTAKVPAASQSQHFVLKHPTGLWDAFKNRQQRSSGEETTT